MKSNINLDALSYIMHRSWAAICGHPSLDYKTQKRYLITSHKARMVSERSIGALNGKISRYVNEIERNFIPYSKTNEGKEYYNKHMRSWIKNNREQYYLNIKKSQAKRQRELGFEKLFDNIIDEGVDWHHVDDQRVIALPRDLHRLYLGWHKIEHRFMCNQIVDQIYNTTLCQDDV